jgi:hypothetical protein
MWSNSFPAATYYEAGQAILTILFKEGTSPNGGVGMNYGFGFSGILEDDLGQTVSIFTTSGGQSGSGFTGTLAAVNSDYARLITQIGSGPGCALGNCCDNFGGMNGCGMSRGGIMLGSIADIPFDKMAAIVRNTVSGW